MLVAAACTLLAPLWVLFSPVRDLRRQPEPLPEPALAG